jgi:uncharacterized protein YeaO (DUF488 family)
MDANSTLNTSISSRLQWLVRCWKLRSTVKRVMADAERWQTMARAYTEELRRERESTRILAIELNRANLKVESLESSHSNAKQGNKALLRFIATRHNVKIPLGDEDPTTDLQE